jgi:hypothetical protein
MESLDQRISTLIVQGAAPLPTDGEPLPQYVARVARWGHEVGQVWTREYVGYQQALAEQAAEDAERAAEATAADEADALEALVNDDEDD